MTRLSLLITPLVFGITGVVVPAVWARQSHQPGIEHRLYPALTFFVVTFGLTWLATHRSRSSRSLLWVSLLTMLAAAAWVCTQMQHELVLLNFPSLFGVPAFLWASMKTSREQSSLGVER